MRSFLLFLFCLVTYISSAQVVFDKTKHDFGDLEAYDDRFVDIKITNTGSKKEYVLSVKKPYDVVYIITGQFMDKDSSQIVRLQVNPKVKGKFSYDVDIFTSDKSEATKIKLSGNLRELPSDNMTAFTACPDFNSRPGGRANNFDLTVVTIDKQTKETLSNSNVTMIQNGQPIWALNTDKNGKIKEDATLGFSYFYASHDTYYPTELGAYINFQRNYIVLELEKNPNCCPPVPVDPVDIVIQEPIESDSTEQIEENLENVLASETPSQTAEVPIELSQLPKDDFSVEHFKPVNVIFVLDISASMKQGDKIELMKYSLNQLVDMLRPQDKIGIVTYATETQILLAPTNGSDKEKIKEQVANLKASGLTAGGAGIKLGYKQALKGFLKDGNNQIIVITDGAFNRNSDDYKKYIKKYKKKNIQMSVVGIKNKEVDELEMKEAAELGGGRYVPIFKLVDAQFNLKEEIRIASFRK